jgi:hypothetical protein
MLRLTFAVLVALVSGGLAPVRAQNPQPAASAFERLKAMEGEWIDVNGALGKPGAVVATYKVTGSGNTVIESLAVATPHEMTTVYHRDGTTLLLTHYCSEGNQPRMRATTVNGNVLDFAFDGGTNIDVATTTHMHNMRWEWISNDEVKAVWHNWSKGREDAGHLAAMHIRRKK